MGDWLSRTSEKCQPCEHYRADHEFATHTCLRAECEKRVYYCDNCNADHHEGGWQTCDGFGKEPRSLACPHPACVARRDEAK